jgi:hypothetical protein
LRDQDGSPEHSSVVTASKAKGVWSAVPPQSWKRRDEAGPPPSSKTDYGAIESSWGALAKKWIGRSASRFGQSAQSRKNSFLSHEAKQVAVLLPIRSDEVDLEDVRGLLRLQRGLRSVGLTWSAALACEDGDCFVLPSLESAKVDDRLSELWRRGHDEDEIALLMAAEFPTVLDPMLANSVPWPVKGETMRERPSIRSGSVEALSEQASLEWVVAQGHEYLRRGKPMNAVRLCKRHGLTVGALGEALDDWMERSYARGSYGELLAFVRAAGMYGPYSAVELLSLAAERGDDASLLKQAHALGIYSALQEPIDAAIARRGAQGMNDVHAWKRKFGEVAESEKAERGAERSKVAK